MGWALEQTDEMELIQQFGTAAVALRKISAFQENERPNLVLLDLNLPGISGLEALPQIKVLLPDASVIILTQSDMQKDVLRAIELGASGYLLKSSSIPQLLEGIQTVHKGGATLDPGLAALIIDSLKQGPRQKDPRIKLSKRELEVLSLIAEGSVQKQIAEQMNLSSHTINEYITNIYKKLNVHNAPAAVNKAHRQGLFD